MVSKEYAVALFQFATDLNKVDTLNSEFKAFVDVVNNNPEFIKLMSHPKLSTGEKKTLIDKINQNIFDSDFIYFIYVLIDNGRFSELEEVYEQYVTLINESSNIMVINAITHKKLSKEEIERLTVILQKKYQKTIQIIPVVDKSVLNGIRFEFDGKVLDTTYKASLADLKSVLL